MVDLRPQPEAGGLPAGASRLWLHPAPGEPPLKPAYRLARQLSIPDEEPPPGQVRIEGWAEVVGTAATRLDSEQLSALDSKTVLALGDLAGRDVLVVALRAHRLPEPVTVPADDLSGLPDLAALSPAPTLSDVAFDARLKGVEGALRGGLSRPRRK